MAEYKQTEIPLLVAEAEKRHACSLGHEHVPELPR
jgi:hypothetical protein